MGVVVVFHGGADVDNHACNAVAAQRVLQQARQLAVAVRDAIVATIEGVNNL